MATFNTGGTDIITNVSSYNTQTGDVKKYARGYPPYAGPNVYTGIVSGTTQASLTLKRGVKNADFKRRMSSGEIVISPYYLRKGLFSGSTMSGKRILHAVSDYRYEYDFSGVAVPTTVIQSLFAQTFYSSSLADEHEAQARTAAFANVGKASFEMGVFLLEGKESAKMLMDRYDKLVRIVVRTVKQAKQRSKSPSDWAKHFADLWLKQRYGIEPFIRDLENLINLGKPKPKIREISLGHSVQTDRTSAFTNTYSSTEALCWTTFSVTGIERVTTRCKVGVFADYTVQNPLWWLCRDLGISSPASILYEITRLSFVLDWFINLGEYIKSYEMLSGVHVVDAWATIKTQYELDLYGLYTLGDSSNGLAADQWGGSMGKVTLMELTRNRAALSPPLVPEIRVKLNANKILDSLALLTQVIKK